jgi:hypothetical protein
MKTENVRLTLIDRAEGGYDGSFPGMAGVGSTTKTVSNLDTALTIVALHHKVMPVTQAFACEFTLSETDELLCFASQEDRMKFTLDPCDDSKRQYVLAVISV